MNRYSVRICLVYEVAAEDSAKAQEIAEANFKRWSEGNEGFDPDDIDTDSVELIEE